MGFFRKLLRRAFYAAAAVSTLLLVATLIVWPVSYYRYFQAKYPLSGQSVYCLSWNSGRAHFGRCDPMYPGEEYHFELREMEPIMVARWNYLTWDRTEQDYAGITWTPGALSGLNPIIFYIPFSYLALLFAILPLLAIRSIRRRRKLARNARLGLCPKCRYDLRAHAPGSNCPECGTPVAK